MQRIGLILGIIAAFILAGTMFAGATTIGTEPHPLAGCFGWNGIQIETQDAYECEHKDADEGGTLYWAVNNAYYQIDLHPDSGNYAVGALVERDNKNHINVFLDSGTNGNGGCLVLGAGYHEQPTRCVENGGNGPVVAMNNTMLNSYNDFAENMDETFPDSDWQCGPGCPR